ncbi:MAG: hypothetical protein EA384_08335 [Spirochaetaceae bacterium]|nr:MAG: hypothetical protein EA384_08335 [Spirochaetaceae bacterium]
MSKGWVHQKTGLAFGEGYYFDSLERRNRDLMIAAFLDEAFPRYRIHNLESNLVVLRHYDPSCLYVGGIQPNLIFGMLLGADFVPYTHQDADISEPPLANLSSIADLPDPHSFLEAPLIRRWLREIELLRKTESDAVIPPFFWDTGGRATIHGCITTALKLFGQGILLAIYDNPQLLVSFYRWYADACVLLVRAFAHSAGITIRSLHVGECSGTMLGPRDYRQHLVAPTEALARRIAPLRLHHCGNCTHLLNEIARIGGLESLDTGSGTSVREIRNVFGPQFAIDLMPPVELLIEGAECRAVADWVDAVLEENSGGPLGLNYHLEPGYDEYAHLQLHETLYAKGLLRPGRV